MPDITPEEFVRRRKAHGLSQQALADFMGTTRNTISRWEIGALPINQGWARLAFEVLDNRLPSQARARS